MSEHEAFPAFTADAGLELDLGDSSGFMNFVSNTS
jgi:hypothetical protein